MTRLGSEPPGGGAVGQFPEALVERGFFDSIGADAKPLEEGLVELPTGGGVRDLVGVLAVAREVEDLMEDARELAAVLLGQGEETLGLCEVCVEAGLLFREEVFGEGIVQVGVEQLALLGLDAGDPPSLVAHLPGVVGMHARDRFVQRGANVVDVRDPVLRGPGAGLTDFHGRVFAGDSWLGIRGGQVGKPAAGTLDAAQAGEVPVDPTGLAFGFDVGQPLPAVGADQ